MGRWVFGACPTFLTRAYIYVYEYVFLVLRVLSLISVRSTCFCLSAEQLDIAVLVRDDAGSRYALLRLVELLFVVPEPAKPYGYTF